MSDARPDAAPRSGTGDGVRVKICGITSVEDRDAAVAAGDQADLLTTLEDAEPGTRVQ